LLNKKTLSVSKKIPANAKENIQIFMIPNDGIAVQATSPGRVVGSKAVYEKQIDEKGKTIQYTKTTYNPQGNIIHVKDKINVYCRPPKMAFFRIKFPTN
jgi:hypothetical protein